MDGFVARCASCGAPQSIVLDRAVAAPCRHCGARDPLAPPDRARVEAAATLVARAATREHRRLVAHRAEVFGVAFLTPLAAGLTWLLFGGLALAVADADLPAGTSLVDVLLVDHEAPADAWLDPVVAGHWLLFLLLLGLAATVTTYLLALAQVRGAVRPPAALPPLSGGPARCHLCGAGLRAGGAMRTCASCGARNVVTGRALASQVASLEEQVAALAAADRRGAEAASAHATRAVLWSALYPLLLVAAFPLGGLVGETRPDLMWIPLAVLAPAVPLLGLVLARPVPRAVKLEEAAPGAEVRVRGAAHVVVARLDLDGARLPDLPPALVLVAPRGSDGPTLAVFLRELAPERPAVAFRVHAGGAPLAPEDAAPDRLATFAIRARGGTSTGAVPRSEAASPPVRVFRHPAVPGAAPAWTLVPATVEPDELFVP